jgi:hypothetical protein
MNLFKKLFGTKTTQAEKRIHSEVTDINEPVLLHNISWNFAEEKFDTLIDFTKSIEAYNKQIQPKLEINFERIFHSSTSITVNYTHWGEDENGDEDQFEEDFVVRTENENGFSVAEFLFKVHNSTCADLLEEDATFFEGLTPHNDGSGIPYFFLIQGS